MTTSEAIKWLKECSRYFENAAAQSSEDNAHWSNILNAQSALRIAELLSNTPSGDGG